MVDRETGRSRGFGFVTYSSESEAEAAIAGLNEQDLDGRRIKVNLANARGGGGGGGGGGGRGGYGSFDLFTCLMTNLYNTPPQVAEVEDTPVVEEEAIKVEEATKAEVEATRVEAATEVEDTVAKVSNHPLVVAHHLKLLYQVVTERFFWYVGYHSILPISPELFPPDRFQRLTFFTLCYLIISTHAPFRSHSFS